MNSLANKIWLAPAAAMLLSFVLLLLAMAPGVAYGASSIVRKIYEIAFWAAPLIGLLTLLIVSACRVFGSIDRKQPAVKRAVRLAGLSLFFPILLLALQILLSGFAR